MTLGVSGCRALITGGTGSFGQTMARRLLDWNADEVRILSRDEAKQDAMRRLFDDDRLRFQVGDVRDYSSVLSACRGIDLVFHAAALKQVPSGESFPMEAIRTNVLGGANVVNAAESGGVASVVVLSTDKAVHPVTAMGMTKGLMEKVVQAQARTGRSARTTASCVRCGNVLYSRGSMLPLLVEQVRSGQPMTVTNPTSTLFLTSPDDAVDLVGHAFTRAQPGDILIHRANACTIADLAEAVCTLFDVPLRLEITGTRYGERTTETLATADELARAEDHGEFFRVPVESRDQHHAAQAGYGSDQPAGVAFDSASAYRLSVPQIVDLLWTLPQVRAEVGASELVVA